MNIMGDISTMFDEQDNSYDDLHYRLKQYHVELGGHYGPEGNYLAEWYNIAPEGHLEGRERFFKTLQDVQEFTERLEANS